MKKAVNRIHILFLLTGLCYLLFGYASGDSTLDINVHDTYFVIALQHIGFLFFVIHLFYSIIYFLIRKSLNYISGLIHLLLIMPLCISIMYSAFYTSFVLGGTTRRYYTNSNDSIFESQGSFSNLLFVFSILFLLAQLVFIGNIIIAITKGIAQRHNK
ncbi:MAG: hypothetical protein V4506_17380 [Bacteroidota bacterium]